MGVLNPDEFVSMYEEDYFAQNHAEEFYHIPYHEEGRSEVLSEVHGENIRYEVSEWNGLDEYNYNITGIDTWPEF